MAIAKGPAAKVNLSLAEADTILAALDDLLTPHEDHPWRQVGRCVYCATCDVRLYQGRIPERHPKADPPPRTGTVRPSTTQRMRDRWNMDDRPSSSSDRLGS